MTPTTRALASQMLYHSWQTLMSQATGGVECGTGGPGH